MIKEIVTSHQTENYGWATSEFIFTEPTTLHQVLEWIEKTHQEWGIITIYDRNYCILRKFDYDLYNNKIFYYHLNQELNYIVKTMTTNHSWSWCDFEIKLQ